MQIYNLRFFTKSSKSTTLNLCEKYLRLSSPVFVMRGKEMHFELTTEIFEIVKNTQ